MTSASGTTRGAKAWLSTFRPSTADSTVMAGVSMPSPKNSARPTMAPMPMVALILRVMPGERCASAASARVPPSPLLSARMMISTYLTVTTRISAQKIIDSEPITATWLGKPAFGGQHGGAQCVKRRGADVAEHHAHGAQHQAEHVAAVIGRRSGMLAIAMMFGRPRQRIAGMAFHQRLRRQSRIRLMGDHG